MKKTSLNSITFIIIISLYFSFALNITFWQFAFAKISVTNLQTVFFAASLPLFIFVPLFLFFCLIILPYIGKPLIILLLTISAASDYAMRSLGIVINSDMIRNFAETNLREACDLITLRAVLHVVFLGILPGIVIAKISVCFSSFSREFLKRLFYCCCFLFLLALTALATYKEYVSFGRNNSEVRRYINTFNYIYACGRYYKRSLDAKRSFVILDEHPALAPKSSQAPRILVLLIGETARAANFSLHGYEQETNPLLKKQNIIYFQNISSCGTATAVSLPCMFAAKGRNDFDVTDAKYTQNLLDIIKAAGYDVWWKDNDDGCKGVCERIDHIDAKDGNKQPYCFGDYCHDDILLDGLEYKIKTAKKDTVIVLHMMGSHGPTYYKRYPERFSRFKPSCNTADLQNCTREQIVNTYNNTILYTDYIVSSAIDILKKHSGIESGLIYISDHGESLGENNIYLHGLPYSIAPDEQKQIPMLLWLSEKLQKSACVNTKCLTQNAAAKNYSHDNFFHSVLRILAVNTTVYDKNLDIFADCSN